MLNGDDVSLTQMIISLKKQEITHQQGQGRPTEPPAVPPPLGQRSKPGGWLEGHQGYWQETRYY